MSDKPPATLATYDGAELCTSTILILLAWLVCSTVGYNRLSCVPLILALFTGLGNLGTYLCDGTIHNDNNNFRYFIASLAYVGWNIEEWAAPFYSYFLLEVITRQQVDEGVARWLNRKFFLWGFWTSMTISLLLRIANVALYIVQFHLDTYNTAHHIKNPPAVVFHWIGGTSTSSMIFTALTEILTAYGLLIVFSFAAKNSELYCGGARVGLFRRMMLSTEIRVGSLAIIGIIRAYLNLPGQTTKQPKEPFGTNLHRFFWNAQHLYSVVLLTDLLISKMAAPRFVKQDKNGTAIVTDGLTLDRGGGGGGGALMTLDTSILNSSPDSARDKTQPIDEEKQLPTVTYRSESS